MRSKWFRSIAVCFAVTLSCVTGVAQDSQGTPSATRSSEIIDAEKAKASSLTPVAPPHGEEKFDLVEHQVIDPLSNPNGLTFQFGGVPTGGGFSLGPRYVRRDLLHEHLTSDSYVVGSTRKWYRASSSLDFVGLLNNHLELQSDGAYENAASMPYFGEGSNSNEGDRSVFRREFTSAHFGGKVHMFGQKFSAGYAVGGLLVNVGPGDRGGWPPTDRIFNRANTPGLQTQSNFVTGTASFTLDLTTRSFSNPKGLILEASDTQFWDQDGNRYNFHRLQTQATYNIPFLNGMRTLAFRLRNETTFYGARQQVPFYLQPTLGGPDDLRGYERYRYYGNGASVVSAEYRWSVAESLEMAAFGDAGNVYSRPGLIGFREPRGDGGIGVRFKRKEQELMRFDVGVSPEGVKVWFVFNNAFGKLHSSY